MSNDFLGLDRSGNDNNWTVNNMTLAADQVVDSPTNNFATLNPLNEDTEALAEGSLQIKSRVGGSGNGFAKSTMAFSSGKWYAEYLWVSGGNGGMPGISPTTASMSDGTGKYYAGASGKKYSISGTSYTDDGSYGSGWSVGDIIGVAMDADANTLTFYKNNSSMGTAYSSLTDEYYFSNATLGGPENIGVWNFGQDSSFAGNKTAQGNQDGNSIGDFYYTPPTGYLALCTSNLPDVAVTPSEHFNTVLYTGNGSTQSITGFGFQPDWIWDKSRNQVNSHMLVDAVRGVGKYLRTNLANAEVDDASVLTSFDSDGVTVGDINGNATSSSSVMWGWKANGSGSSNTDGSSNSTVSANTDAGFSIVSYTGQSGAQTIGHGLSKTPEMIILKNRSDADEWLVYYGYKDNYLRLDTNAAEGDNTFWNDTAPTPSVFSVGDSRPSNSGHGSNYIAYCFHSVDGYSKADGFYIGNASTDGVFNYCGFSPKWIMIKRKNAVNNWYIYDTARTANNPNGTVLLADSSNAEATQTYFQIDILSNGWKARASDGAINTSGEYIYLAFAETPFKYSNAR